MTVSSRNGRLYRCGCPRWESETLQRSPHGVAELITNRFGTHDPRVGPRMTTAPYYADDYVTLYHGDCRDVLPSLADGSVDMVLTDPPYPAEFLPLYGVLGEQSGRLLRHGGHLVSLCGHYQVPDVFNLIHPHLRYWWLCGMSHSSKQRLPGKWVAGCGVEVEWVSRATGGLSSSVTEPGDHECRTETQR
jgi:hypothetical protein